MEDIPYIFSDEEHMSENELLYNGCINEKWHWDGSMMAPLVLTNFPLEYNNGWGSDKYHYITATNSKGTDEPWKFLSDLKYVDGWRYNYFKAVEKNTNDALTQIQGKFKASKKKAILFYIHGWNSEIYSAFCATYKLNKASDYLVVPVIWNTDRGLLSDADYRYDRVVTAPAAGMHLDGLYNSFFKKITTPKSWLCHSMGCFVTQNFVSDLNDDGKFENEAGKFENLFMVAPDVRYDIFNEYTPGAGKDKNECYEGQWNDPDASKRIPDCRSGGGKALSNMRKNKLFVFWNGKDEASWWREFRLKSDLTHNWPISYKGLLGYGNEGRTPSAEFKNLDFVKVSAAQLKKDGASEKEHSFHALQFMIDYYDAQLPSQDRFNGSSLSIEEQKM